MIKGLLKSLGIILFCAGSIFAAPPKWTVTPNGNPEQSNAAPYHLFRDTNAVNQPTATLSYDNYYMEVSTRLKAAGHLLVTPPSVVISQDGTGDVNYTPGMEWHTVLQLAYNMLPASGGQIFVKKGIYTINGTQPSLCIFQKPINMQSEGPGLVIISISSPTASTFQALYVTSAPFTIEGFILENTKDSVKTNKGLVGIYPGNPTLPAPYQQEPVTIKNCVFRDKASRPDTVNDRWMSFSMAGGYRNKISGCTFENMRYVNLLDSPRTICVNNTFINSQVQFAGQDDSIGWSIEGSIFSNNTLYMSTNPMRNNTVSNVTMLYVDTADNCQVTGNIFEVTNTTLCQRLFGLKLVGFGIWPIRGLAVANNVFRSARAYVGGYSDIAINVSGDGTNAQDWLITNNVNFGWHDSFQDDGGVINCVYTGNLNEGIGPDAIRNMDYSGTKYAVTHTTTNVPSTEQMSALTMSYPFNSQTASIGMWPNNADNRLELKNTAGRFVLRGDGTKGAGGTAVSPALYLISNDTATAGGHTQVRMNYDRANNTWNFNGYNPRPNVSWTNINGMNVNASLYCPAVFSFNEFWAGGNDAGNPPTLYVSSYSTVGIGIGTNAPSGTLHVEASGGGVVPLYVNSNFVSKMSRTTNNIANSVGALALFQITDGDMANGFGVHMPFVIKDSSGVDNYIAAIGASRDGADNQGALRFLTNGTAFANEKMRISQAGNVGIGTVSPASKLHISSGIQTMDGSVTGWDIVPIATVGITTPTSTNPVQIRLSINNDLIKSTGTTNSWDWKRFDGGILVQD